MSQTLRLKRSTVSYMSMERNDSDITTKQRALIGAVALVIIILFIVFCTYLNFPR